MKPFNLEQAIAGKPVVTRKGRPVRIICFDRKSDYPIVALVEKSDGKIEELFVYDNSGITTNDHMHDHDLSMAPEKYERWVNIYHSGIVQYAGRLFNTREVAMEESRGKKSYITTIKVEWEE